MMKKTKNQSQSKHLVKLETLKRRRRKKRNKKTTTAWTLMTKLKKRGNSLSKLISGKIRKTKKTASILLMTLHVKELRLEQLTTWLLK